MTDLITGYQTHENPRLFLENGSNVNIKEGTDLALEFSSERFCIGFDPPGERPQPCPKKAYALQGAQCESCLQASFTLPCVRCIGRFCNNPHRREKCIFQDHFVYLAFYDSNIIKVGVTRKDRFEMRIFEQGAFAAISIAGAGGQEVRKIEHFIAQAGWRDRTNLLPLLSVEVPSKQEVFHTLEMEKEKIKQRFPQLPIGNGKKIWLGDKYPSTVQVPPRTLNPKNDALTGKSLGVRGNYLLFRQDSENLVCSLRTLVGRKITTQESKKAGIAQGTLF